MNAARPVEVELKYRLANVAAGERLLVADTIGPFAAASPIHTTQHEDRYLDTGDGALAHAGFAARLRTSASGTIVTVKSLTNGGSGAVNRREELEGPAERASQPRDWQSSAARSLILELCGDAPLVETVTVRQLRRRRELQGLGAAVELSLDEVDVVARSRVIERFAELEIELLSGTEQALDKLGDALADEPGLTAQARSKLESALRAARGSGVRERDVEAAAVATEEARDVPTPPAPATTGRTRRIRTHGSGARRRSAGDRAHGHELLTEPNPATIPQGTAEPRTATVPAPTPPETAPEGGPEAGADHDQGEPGPQSPERAAGEVARSARREQAATDAGQRLSVGKTPGVLPDDALAEAGRKVLRFHFARMLNKEPGTRSGADPEDLHGMRVATRRMRAAWRVFGDAFRAGRVKTYRRSMRDIAGRLGAVRDLDVLLEAAEAYRAELPEIEARGISPLLAEWRSHRDDARVLLLRELDSDDYVRFVEDFKDFVRTEGAGARAIRPMVPHRVRDTAASRIQAAFEQVRAYESVLRWADVETLHELRIASKWLRYTVEFVRETLGPEAEPLIARVVALQDHLGALHDADVAASLARTFLVQHSGQISATETAAIGRYLVNREREVARLRRTVGPVWRGVAGLAFRRRLGRALATL